MKPETRKVLEKATENRVKFVRLQVTDFNGAFKNLAVTVEELEQVLYGQFYVDSAIIGGFSGTKIEEILLLPDPETFVIFPWRPRDGAVARLICQAVYPQGEPYPLCSRTVLQKALVNLQRKGWVFRVAPEVEFFLFQAGDQGPTTTTHDRAGYCDLTPVDLGENARREMVLTLQEMGISVRSSHHEVSPGQHEISLLEEEALTAADQIATFKFVVRTVAQRHGLHASFMPRPLADRSGSGMKLNLSLWREGENVFIGESGPSELTRSFAAGIIKHGRALTAVSNPLVNSYKRLVPDGFHPALAAWSEDSRATMLQLPKKEGGTAFLSWRSPDPAANPYLSLTAVLAAGLDGLATSEVLPDPVPGAAGTGLNSLRTVFREKGLPRHLEGALAGLREDLVLQKALGEELCQRYLIAKEAEWEEFLQIVHPWEIETYLTRY